MRVMVIPVIIDALGTVPKGLVRELEEMEIGGRNSSIVKIGSTTEKSPKDLRIIVVTQTLVKVHQQTLV